MNSAETNGGFQPNFVQDSKGQIYLPTVAGVAVISAGNVSKNSVPPPVFIEDVKTIDSTLSLNDDLTISHNTPYLEINYTAVNFTEPKKVSFKYKLVGLDDHWITVGNARKAIYSKIPAGEYRFHVLARNDHGVWNNTGASIGIYVTPPFWQRWWFYTLSGLFLLGLAGTALYRREQKFQRETERQKRFTEQLIESQEQERRRIANELHDSLGQQILVIKNRAELAQLQVDDRKELLEQLKEITGSAVQSIENVRSISHGLRPVHLEKFGLTESLENLCDQVMQSPSIDWSYQIDKVDDIFEERKVINFYRIVQEGITNILRHSEATEASVFVRRSDEVVNVKLWDNGKGINKQTQKMSNGLGFLGMNERSGTLGGHLDVQSEPGNGTTITLTIPLQKS
jgi:signal transduction histidine kinase